MEKRIALERRGRSPAEITELNLDNCKSTTVVGLSSEWANLESLSLINVGLTSLKGFPSLPNLRRLELSDNRISGGLEALASLPKLNYLNLSGNKIKDIEALEPLKSLSSLVNLDLFNCDVSQAENYKEKVFELIPSLVYLDGFDKEDNSEEEEEDEEDGEVEVLSSEKDGAEDGKLDDTGELDDLDDEDDLGDEEDEDDDDEEDDDDDDDEYVSLDAIYKDYDADGDDDYEAGEEEEDDDIEEEAHAVNSSTEAENAARGQKRKHEED